MASGITLDKSITKASAVSGLWSLTLSDVNGILLGAKADVGGFMTQSYNVNNVTVLSVNTTTNVVTYQHGNATVAQFAPDANFHLNVAWIDAAYVADMLGFTPTGDDLAYLEECVESAQDWAYRRRAEAGWNPHPGYPGGADIRLGTGLYAMGLYRERGSVDSFQSYEVMATAGPVGNIGQIMRLLGIGRAQVA